MWVRDKSYNLSCIFCRIGFAEQNQIIICSPSDDKLGCYFYFAGNTKFTRFREEIPFYFDTRSNMVYFDNEIHIFSQSKTDKKGSANLQAPDIIYSLDALIYCLPLFFRQWVIYILFQKEKHGEDGASTQMREEMVRGRNIHLEFTLSQMKTG